jgi:hypothetical protein
MHREVFRLKGRKLPRLVDHKNRNGLDNRWENLRPATRQQQSHNRGKRRDNTSGYIGVYPCGPNWRAKVRVNSKDIHLGNFADKFSAAWVRDEFIKSRFPEFGVTNNLCDRRRKSVLVKLERRKC